MHRIGWSTAVGLLAGVFLAWPAMAQTPATETPATPTTPTTVAIVARNAVVLEAPRTDSITVGEVARGMVLEVLVQFNEWYLVRPPADSKETVGWQSGWMHGGALQLPDGPAAPPSVSGRLMVRGFGHAGGLLFTARNSFEAILGGTLNSVYGAGGQIVFPNGAFAQISIDRLRDTGSRALVSGTQVFTLEIPNRITVTPILVTGGYRGATSGRVAPYVGGGIGWYTLEENSPSVSGAEGISQRHAGYHVLGGAEFPVMRWLWIAGELQWATVPKALGETGVSAVFGEADLGGTTFRFKVIVGY